MPTDALIGFDAAIRTYADSILAVRRDAEHSKARIDAAKKALSGEKPSSVTPPAGRRWAPAQLNRPVTIVTAAIWQAYVEGITEAVHTRRIALNQATCTQAEIKPLLEGFSTPNSMKSVHRWFKVGMDVESVWPLVCGSLPAAFPDTMIRLDAWLLVRHKFAHGLAVGVDPPSPQGSSAAVEWAIVDPRVTGNGNSSTPVWEALVRDEVGRLLPYTAKASVALGGGKQRSVHLKQAEANIAFFRELATAVDAAAARFM